VSEDARRCSVFVGWSAATTDSPVDISLDKASRAKNNG
jgi:hypothetical protein